MDMLLALLAVVAVIVLTPLLIWLFQALPGRKPKSGVGGAFMDGFATVFEPQQERVQDAKREKQKGGRENGEPPSQS